MKNIFLLLITLSVFACKDKVEDSNASLRSIALKTDVAINGLIEVSSVSFINNNHIETPVPIPKKIIPWGDSYLYQTNEISKNRILLFDKSWNLLNTLEPSTGGPGAFRVISDFFIWKELLHVYDFESQKFVLFDKDLTYVKEIRSGFYFQNIVASKDVIIAYSGKRSQYVDSVSYSYDLMLLDDEMSPTKYLRKFDPNKFNGGVILNTLKPLIASNNQFFYTEFWNDSIFSIQTNEVEPAYKFKYASSTIPNNVSSLNHAELLNKIRNREFSNYDKGASPMLITDDLILYSYGTGDKLKYGIYNRKNNNSVVFENYQSTVEEQLLIPQYTDNKDFVSFIYPYELESYIDAGLVSEDLLSDIFLSELNKEPEDGRPIQVKFRFNTI